MNQIPLNGGPHIQGCLGANRISAATGLPIPCSSDSGGGFPTAGGGVAACDTATQAWWGLLPDAPPGVNECTDPLGESRRALEEPKRCTTWRLHDHPLQALPLGRRRRVEIARIS